MGLNINGTRFLLYAKTLGVDFSQFVMIGRQGLHVSAADFKKNLRDFGFSFDEQTISSIFKKNDGYAEEFLRYLGSQEVHSFDNSGYEGATHLHDMNHDIPDSFRERYTVVLDGGSLEHIFNFPVAIKNCMEMVQVGGHYLAITPANNFMGHGFYQFSPELFFSIFTESNGFALIDVIAYENKKNSTWFSVKSPVSANSPVTLINSAPVYLLVIAKRISKSAIFGSTPQQSDYVSVWNKADAPRDPSPMSSAQTIQELSFLRTFMKRRILKPLQKLFRPSQSGFNPRFFQPINPAEKAQTLQRKR